MSLSISARLDRLRSRGAAIWARFLTWAMAQSLLKLAFIAAVIRGLLDLCFDPARLSIALGDTDDATRLTEVRQLIAGQSWFDMSMPRFGGHDALISHWSRLIDLPLAAMIVALSPIFGQDTAELITRMLWPTLLSVVIIFMVARYVDSIAKRNTALLALVLATPAMGHFQFAPGRIDHHNGMIVGAVGGTFALLAAIDRPKLGWLAGALMGTGVAIGYEGLGLTIAALTIVTLACVIRNISLEGMANAAIAFAGVLALAYPLFGPFTPATLAVCDALSPNLIAMAVSAAFGTGLAHLARTQGASIPVTFGIVAVSGIVGLALYGIANPVCLGGPYADLDPRLGPIWLNHVTEVQSFLSYYKTSVLDFGPFVIYLAAAAYGVVVVRARNVRHADLYLAIFLITMALGFWQIRLLPYASFLGAPLLALGLHRPQTAKAPAKPFVMPAFSKPGMAIAGTLAAVLTIGAGIVLLSARPMAAEPPVEASAIQPAEEPATGLKPYDICTSKTAIAPLAGLEKGLAASDIDMGPYIVAYTKLDVLTAPYHRLGRTILATHDLMNASASEAKLRMRQLGARYIIICKTAGTTIAAAPQPGDYLRGALLAGNAPDFLEPIPLAGTEVKVWRLKD